VKKLTIIGAGWSGLACAVAATQAGWQVELYETSHTVGGRARNLEQSFAGVPLDNGQHILLGAYQDTLHLMRTVGVNPETVLLRLPLDLRTADGLGFKLPSWPSYLGSDGSDVTGLEVTGASPNSTGASPNSYSNLRVVLLASLKLLQGIAFSKGWRTADKWRLLQACWRWQIAGFTCDAAWSVHQLCEAADLTPRVVQGLIEPLCLSALNMPLQSASAAVFLRVLRDAMLSAMGSSDLLIPRTDLGTLFPQACLQWLSERGAQVHLGRRFTQEDLAQWRAESDNALLKAPFDAPLKAPLNTSWDAALNAPFDASLNAPSTKFVKEALVLACPAWEAARLTQAFAPHWSAKAEALSHTAIATVYLRCHDTGFSGLTSPMVALHMGPNAPAQFVFDRGALCQQHGLLAAVVSASQGERDQIASQVQQQVAEQLGLQQLSVIQTVVEKRATFACLPNTFEGPDLEGAKPDMLVAPNIFACGDYVRGPYPSTLEGAVRSGLQLIRHLG
jgi:hypothetical protein